MFTINFNSMGKSKKSINKVIEKDIQNIKKGKLSRILGGKLNEKKNKWTNGLNGITPQ